MEKKNKQAQASTEDSPERPKLEGALSLALSSAELHDVAAEFAELGVDAFLEQGIARDIPIVSTLVATARVGITIRDRQFAKKLLKFLGEMGGMPADERRGMIKKLESDAKYGRKAGEHLVEILDRIESEKKPVMVARVLRAYGEGTIDALMLHRLLNAIERIPLYEIPAFRKPCEGFPENLFTDVSTQLAFSAAGLATFQESGSFMRFDPTPVGRMFLQLDLDRL